MSAPTSASTASRRGDVISRFAVTLFVSATLLFACQPMVARMIVPLLGGAPAVWILCSLCFQALVLGGYFYAHVVGSRLPVRTQVMMQLALIASAFFVLPIVVDEQLVETLTTKSRSLGLLVVLLRSVGLPFFVLSTTSPLLQRWYAELGETDPYHLYAASNAGSMVALLGYPFAVEPFLGRAEGSDRTVQPHRRRQTSRVATHRREQRSHPRRDLRDDRAPQEACAACRRNAVAGGRDHVGGRGARRRAGVEGDHRR